MERPRYDFFREGAIVKGSQFVGREEQLRDLTEVLFERPDPGRIAVIGLARSGKSSLVWRVTQEPLDDLLQRGYLPIWLNVGTYHDGRALLNDLVSTTQRLIVRLARWTPVLEERARAAREAPSGEFPADLLAFFELVREAGFRPFAVLDEFDSARSLFKHEDGAEFQLLRQLTYVGRHPIGMILICRRPIWRIERHCDISNLDQVFARKVRLRAFAEDEVLGCRDAMQVQLGWSTGRVDGLWRIIIRWAGRWPFPLINGVAEVLRRVRRGEQEGALERAVDQELRMMCQAYFRSIQMFLRDDLELFGKLVQFFVGPSRDFTPEDEDILLQYGLIDEDEQQGSVRTMSDAFLAFLEGSARNMAIWPLWTETERALRRLVTSRLAARFGDDWEAAIARPATLTNLVAEMRVRREHEERVFGVGGSLLDYSYPSDLFAIIFNYWDLFVADLGKDKRYWDARRSLLARARTGLAHARVLLRADEQTLLQAYCEEILMIVTASRV